MPVVPRSSDIPLTDLRPAAAPQIDIGVAANIGKAGRAWGNAIEALGSGFSELAGRYGQAQDQANEPSAKLAYMQAADDAWRATAAEAGQDGEAWSSYPSRLAEAQKGIDERYPISDPKKRRNFEMWRDEYTWRQGRRALDEQQGMRLKSFVGQFDSNVDGVAKRIEAGDISPEQFQDYASGLYGQLDAQGPSEKYPYGVSMTRAQIEAKKAEINARLTGAILGRVGQDKPEEVQKFWGDVRQGHYELEDIKQGQQPAGATKPGTELQHPQGGSYGLGRQGNANGGQVGGQQSGLTSGKPMDVAKQYLGMNENQHTETLAAFFKKAGGQDLDPSDTAWCAAFVNAAIGASGQKGTGTLVARDFLKFGTATDKPSEGDIVVFSRGDPNGWQGHVGFYAGRDRNGNILVLGGNQGNKVSIAAYPASRVLGFRKPPESGTAIPGIATAPPKGNELTSANSPELATAGAFEAMAESKDQSIADAYAGDENAALRKEFAGYFGGEDKLKTLTLSEGARMLRDKVGSKSGSAQTAGITSIATAYSPKLGGDKTEGGYASAKPGPDGKAEVRTLADVAAGRSQYVTLAGDPSQYGKTYTIPEITFTDASGKTQTLKNVKGVVHDTGSDFNGKGDGRIDIPADKDLPDGGASQPYSNQKVALIPSDQQGGQPVPMAQRGQITAERYTPGPNESGVPLDKDRERFVLKGTPEQKAQQLREIVSAGYGDVVHSLASKTGDDVVAVKQGPPNWQTNGVAKDDAPASIRNRLSDDGFGGPTWAKDVIAEMRSGKVAASSGLQGQEQAATGRSLGDYLRERLKEARAEPDRPLSEVLPPEAIEEIKPFVGKDVPVDRVTVADALGALDAMRNKDGRVDVADASDAIPRSIRERMATADPNAKLSDVVGDLPEAQKLRSAFPDLFDDETATVNDAREFAETMGIDLGDTPAGRPSVFSQDIMRPGYKGKLSDEFPMGRLQPGQSWTVGGFKITSDMLNGIDAKQRKALDAAARERMKIVQRQREVVATEMMRNAESSMEQNGQPPQGYDAAGIKAVMKMNPREVAKHEARMRVAQSLYSTFNQSADMSIDEIAEKVDGLYPKAGSPHEAEEMAGYDKAVKKLADLEGLRTPGTRHFDPVESVDPSQAVSRRLSVKPSSMVEEARRAMQSGKPSNRSEALSLIEARLSAQALAGIDEASRQPLTMAEARRMAGPLRGMDAGTAYDNLPKIEQDVRSKFGDRYAGVITRQIIDVALRDKKERQTFDQTLDALAEEGKVGPTSLAGVREKERLDSQQPVAKPAPPPQRSVWQKMGDYVPSLPGPDVGKNIGVELYPPMASKRSTPPAAAVDALVFKDKADPYQVEKFRRHFGLRKDEVDAMVRKRLQGQ